MQGGLYIYNGIVFDLRDERVRVRTVLGQSFLLEPSFHYYNRRMAKVRRMIELQEIKSLEELASHTNGVIDWIPCRAKAYLI